jgi:hypothetical protein
MNVSLRSKCRQYQEYTTNLEQQVAYYKAECEKKWNAVPVETLEYWRGRFFRRDRENEELRAQIERIYGEQKIARNMFDVVERAIYIEVIVIRLIDAIVDDQQLRREVLKAGLLTKIRFIAQFGFIEKNMNNSIGSVLFYHPFIRRWDGEAKQFCEFRNKVCHEWKFLESLNDQREKSVSDYTVLYEKLRNSLAGLEHVINSRDDLNKLKKSDLLSANQSTNRLKELRLPVPV